MTSSSPRPAAAYLRDLPDAKLVRLDSGHFATEDRLQDIVDGINSFYDETVKSTGRTTMRALIDGVLLADADSRHIISIEGSHYFPPDSLTIGTLNDSPTPYVCPWKGQARYYNVETPHHEYVDAAWCYPHPKRSAIETVGHDFTAYVAFDVTRVTIEHAEAPRTGQSNS